MHQHRTPLSRPLRTWALTISLCSVAVVAPLKLPAVSSADYCPNAVYRNGPSSRLPDCRAYEMVTPSYTEGYPVRLNSSLGAISKNGLQVWGESLGVFAWLGRGHNHGWRYH